MSDTKADIEELVLEGSDLLGMGPDPGAAAVLRGLIARVKKADRIAEERAQFANKLLRRLAQIATHHPQLVNMDDFQCE